MEHILEGIWSMKAKRLGELERKLFLSAPRSHRATAKLRHGRGVVLATVAVASLPRHTAAYEAGAAVGVNWGTRVYHPPCPPLAIGVRMLLLANGVDRVKMFDAEPWTGALVDTRIQIVIAVPNDHLAYLSSDPRSARLWVRAERPYYLKTSIDVREYPNSYCIQGIQNKTMEMFLDCERRNFVIQGYHRELLEQMIASGWKPPPMASEQSLKLRLGSRKAPPSKKPSMKRKRVKKSSSRRRLPKPITGMTDTTL